MEEVFVERGSISWRLPVYWSQGYSWLGSVPELTGVAAAAISTAVALPSIGRTVSALVCQAVRCFWSGVWVTSLTELRTSFPPLSSTRVL